MSKNVKLHIDPSFDLQDIIDVLKKRFECIVNSTPTDTQMVLLGIQFLKDGITRGLSVHSVGANHQRTLMMAFDNKSNTPSQDGAVHLMKELWLVLGGTLSGDDMEDKWTSGMMSQEDGLPFMMKQAVLSGKMKNEDDINGFIESLLEENEYKYTRPGMILHGLKK